MPPSVAASPRRAIGRPLAAKLAQAVAVGLVGHDQQAGPAAGRSSARPSRSPPTARPARRARPRSASARSSSSRSTRSGRSAAGLHAGARRLGEQVLGHGPLDRRPLGPHPHAASRQPPRQIGHDVALRPDDEADHPLRRARLAGRDAGAQRTGRRRSREARSGSWRRQEPRVSFLRLRPWPLRAAAASSAANQCSRAFMMMALAVSLSIALSPTISRSSSEARSARSSRVFTPFSPSATSIGRVRPSVARTSSSTPSSSRRVASSASRFSMIFAGAALQLGGDLLVEALDAGQVLDRGHRTRPRPRHSLRPPGDGR